MRLNNIRLAAMGSSFGMSNTIVGPYAGISTDRPDIVDGGSGGGGGA